VRRHVALALLLAGCAVRPPVEPFVACRMAKDSRTIISEGSPRDLKEIAYGTPVEGQARGAYAQMITSYVLTVAGAAAMAGGLITGLATDPASTEQRTFGLAFGGASIGIVVVGLVLTFTMPRAIRNTRQALLHYADRCIDQPPPASPPPPQQPPPEAR
jgi:hypothetical protein